MGVVMLTAPLGLVGIVPMLLAFNQPFGFNAILGLIGLAGILMRNTLILTEQIKVNRAAGLDDYHAVIEATVQRTRPVILTALAAVLAFVPLTHSVFWGSMAYTLIGGTAVGTVLILLFVPALYAAWFRIRPAADEIHEDATEELEVRVATAAEHGSEKPAPCGMPVGLYRPKVIASRSQRAARLIISWNGCGAP